MPDPGDIRARLAAVEAELWRLVGPVTMRVATCVEVTRYHELYRERESLLNLIRLENVDYEDGIIKEDDL
jgi:hypothetical protein